MRDVQSTVKNQKAASTGELTLDVALTPEGLILDGNVPPEDSPVIIPLPLNTDWNAQSAVWGSAKMVSPRIVSLKQLSPSVVEVLIKAFVVTTDAVAHEKVAATVAPRVLPAAAPRHAKVPLSEDGA